MILRILVLPVALLVFLPSLLPGAGPDPEIAKLIAVLQDSTKDNKEKTAACHKLAEQGPKAAPAVPALISLLATDDTGLGLAAADALGEIGPQALPEAVKALGHKDRRTRTFAVVALSQLSRTNEAALPALVGALKDDDGRVRRVTRLVLVGRNPKVVPHLIKTLAEEHPTARAGAAEVLGLITEKYPYPKTEAAIPALTRALRDSEARVRLWSLHALALINNGTVSPPLAPAGPAVGALLSALEDPDPGVRRVATSALGSCGTQGRLAVLSLAPTLADQDEAVRQGAAESLARLAASAEAALPALRKALGDAKESVRLEAAAALWRISRRPQPRPAGSL
jgi:HEAT repeat protein